MCADYKSFSKHSLPRKVIPQQNLNKGVAYMGLLPELNSNGELKKENKVYVMPRTSKVKKSYFEWQNLLLNRCPSCGEFFPQKSGDRECKNHLGNSIRIPEFKFVKICRDLENKQPRYGQFN